MRILDNYEDISGQQINRHKSHFITSPCAFPATIRRVQDVTDFTNKESPLTYLGFPLYTGRKRIVHFNDLVDKVVDRIKGWKSKMMSYGGRETLIRYVMQYLPVHLLSAVSPPKSEEGGIAFRSIQDKCKSMEFKQWWLFRTKPSLWSNFLRAKYYQRSNPISKKWHSGQSQTWKRMTMNRKKAEDYIR
ncbi:uncharacterized protein [Nicotiana tomentosiformis]|uniref:uncharacterized protein n=1 Tax=Nicotiana tomentosiformis TaxID=4098 RepID=UPI00388C913C